MSIIEFAKLSLNRICPHNGYIRFEHPPVLAGPSDSQVVCGVFDAQVKRA